MISMEKKCKQVCTQKVCFLWFKTQIKYDDLTDYVFYNMYNNNMYNMYNIYNQDIHPAYQSK